MADTIKKVVLPSAGEILYRLDKLTPPDPFLSRYYYPLIAKYSGYPMSAKGLVIVLVFCTRQLIGVVEPDVMEEFLGIKIKHIVDVLIDDPDVAAEAKSFYQRAFDAAIS